LHVVYACLSNQRDFAPSRQGRMKRLVFVRHGSTDSNATGVMRGWTDDPLSVAGRHQAKFTAQYLQTLAPVDCIYTSTLARAVETGNMIAAELNVPVHSRQDLRELNLGTLEGRSERELWEYFAKQAADQGMAQVIFPNGEAVAQFLQRTQKAFAEIIASHPDSALIVSHGVQTMVMLGMWFEKDFSKWTRFRVDNCSVTETVFEPAPRLLRVNDTNHLQKQ
jgi:2,3-bisphosphoglycerate-dependent phosphoglycerate mutase